jgi:hypothetical protein
MVLSFIKSLDFSSLGIGSLLGVLIGGLLGHRLALRRDRTSRLTAASQNFRLVFEPALVSLQATNEDPCRILYNFYPQMRAAVEEFERFLPASRRMKLRRAWIQFASHPAIPDAPHFEQYSKYLGSVSLASQNRILAIERLKRLLFMATYT